MARYYFHLRDGVDELLDSEGRVLESLAGIAAMALVDARSIISEEARQGRVPLHERIEVEDEAGSIVHTLHFTDAVEIVRPDQAE